MDIPDLLDPNPTARIDFEATDLGIVMAFAGGTSGGLFQDALAGVRPPASSWQPESYCRDLFLANFISECFQVRIAGHAPHMATEHLRRILYAPPSALPIVAFRREVIWELTGNRLLRTRTEQLYTSLTRLRATLEGGSGLARKDARQRQLSVLEAFRDVITEMCDGFDCATSGLSRLADFGARVAASEPYRSLVKLLAYEECMAQVRFSVSIGADGRVRRLELGEVEEALDNPFVTSPLRRWLAKLEMFLRGYHCSEGEVMARLLDAVFEGVRPEFVPLVQVVGDLEFYLGALALADAAAARGLPMCLPEVVPADKPREIEGLYNPLLLAQTSPVPCDIYTKRHDSTILITGPNSGGKTRLLQSVGLAQLLAQAGLFVPARRAQLALAPALVMSLLQETRVDQTEGRLGVELMRIRALFESLPPGAMVILDELCSGTNPSEGQQIFELVLKMLERLNPQAFITTHFLDFATRLKTEQAVARLDFLQVQLTPSQQPTYQFVEGVAKTSLAAQAAARLGVTGEQLMALIERNVTLYTAAGR